MTSTQVGPRPLTSAERADILKILASAGGTGIEMLRSQVAHATVAGGIPTLIELAVDRSVPPAPVADGPVAARWAAESAAGSLLGELIVWVRNGYLDAFEYAWLTDAAPAGFPPPERLRAVPEDPDRDTLAAEARERAAREAALAEAEQVSGDESDEPGWRTDPTGRHQLRYHDGEDWTDHVADDGIQSEDLYWPRITPAD